MLVGAAVCPHPPVLVPEVAGAAAAELDTLRTACDRAVRGVIATDPELIAVVGTEPAAKARGGTLAAYGAPVRVGTGAPTLSLAHTVGCWLLDRAAWHGARRFVGPGEDDVTEAADRVALLVMGDGSARRSEKAPGYIDERAAPYDAAVSAALASGPDALGQLDGALARELLAAGWPAWQLLARTARGAAWRTEVSYDDAPYGVGYVVALWLRA
jgi:hypothetical protein